MRASASSQSQQPRRRNQADFSGRRQELLLLGLLSLHGTRQPHYKGAFRASGIAQVLILASG